MVAILQDVRCGECVVGLVPLAKRGQVTGPLAAVRPAPVPRLYCWVLPPSTVARVDLRNCRLTPRGTSMKIRRPLRALVFLLLVASVTLVAVALADHHEHAAPAGEKTADGFTRIFNGKNLDGWYTFLQQHGHDKDPDKIITITDEGYIHLYKHATDGDRVVMGYIGTNEEYSHYHFRVQYKWLDKKFAPRHKLLRDAGIYYHKVGRDFVWPRAMQYQVERTNIGDIVTVGHLRYETWVDPETKDEKKPTFMLREDGGVEKTWGHKAGITHLAHRGQWEVDGWNQIDLIVRGDRAEHWLNGRLVAKCKNMRQPKTADTNGEYEPLTKGKILLEIEAAEMYFRNVEIKLLDEGDE
ncbi:MAG: DUF1080 domain-containing protein [Planctomycetota bacterium]|nr:MAG: DUF1080 domain-containing protein [Planctomycetota bacterium]